MTFLTLSAVCKSFGAAQVVTDFNLAVEKGEFISFLGPSGCGKTTVLRMIAGFEDPSAGRIMVGGRDITHIAPNRRNVGMVFQAYALFPNMTVADNVAFGLKVAKRPADEIRARVAEMLALIKLPQIADRYPYQLSGGQQQRVALARALAPQPNILLLDEPLSALDAKVRVSLRDEIRALQRKLGITTIFVTHDQEEALSMSDRVVVMHNGRVDQTGTPFEIYNRPATRFVAGFVGTLNVLPAVSLGGGKIGIESFVISTATVPPLIAGQNVAIALRPEALHAMPAGAGQNEVEGIVESITFLGALLRLQLRVAGVQVTVDSFNKHGNPPPAIGERLALSFAPEDVLILGDDT